MCILLLTLLVPFAGVLLLLALPPKAARLHRGVALAAAAASVPLAIGLYFHQMLPCCGGHGPIALGSMPVLGFAITLDADGLSRPLCVLAALVGLAAVLVSGDVRDRTREFYALVLLTIGAAFGAFLSTNLFFLYFFAELATLPKFLLIGVWGARPPGSRGTREQAAMQVALYVVGGALAVLVALAMLFFAAGTLDLRELAALPPGRIPVPAQNAIYGLLLLGCGVWASMWPFHAWAPAAYSAAPPAGSMLFAGVVKNFGAYLLLRLGLQVLPEGAQAWAPTLAALATVNVLYAAWAALRQRDWNDLIAYGSISHAGYLLLALAAGGVLGGTAAVVFMFAHGVGTALLFALTGWAFAQTGRRHIDALGGLAHLAPFAAVAMSMAVLAASGLPGFGNFAGEIMIFAAMWKEQTLLFQVATVASVWTVVTTAVYFLRALRTSFHGPVRADLGAVADASPSLKLAAVLLLAASLATGVVPGWIAGPARDALAAPSAAAAARTAVAPAAEAEGRR